MSSAGRSARSRTGRVLPGPRARLVAVAAGLGLMMLQPGALAAGTFKHSPNLLTVGQSMTLEATMPAADPTATPPVPDPSGYTYAWDFDNDGSNDHFGATVSDSVKPNSAGPPYTQTVRLQVFDPAAVDPTIPVHEETEALPVGYAPELTLSQAGAGAQPRSGDKVTFTADATDQDNDIDQTSWRWKVDNQNVAQSPPSGTLEATFNTPGKHTVEVRVQDMAGRPQAQSRQVNIEASPPQASFVYSPSEPTTDDAVFFDGRSSADPDGTELAFAWDTDGDGNFDDGDSDTLSRRFDTPGEHTVALRVVDRSGANDVLTKTFTVKAAPVPPAPNQAPKASMTVTPRDPEVNQTVTLTSTASDSDGRITRVQWDLNNDGRFTDGATVTSALFSTPGNHVVALKVFDNDGASATAFETIAVKEPAPPPVVQANRTLNPFPVVRIRGVILRRGVRVQILSVRAGPGVSVSVRCHGRGCPRRTARATITRGSGGVRVKAFERTLRPGIVLEVRVTKTGWVGKFTRFTIRKRSAPRRTDLCVGPVSTRPVKCEA